MPKWFNQNTMAMRNTWMECRVKVWYLIALIVVSSCSPTPDNSSSQKTVPVAKAPAYEVYQVEIKDMKFIPDSITVKKGDEVVFVNRDMVAHCVTEERSKAWTSSEIAAGASYLLVVKESSNYYCAIHTVMKGKIVVK